MRVGHALGKLPKTREAFSSGLLSYSKARAITRVGNEHNEECLLSYARYGTASQLDKTVRLYRQQYDEAGVMLVGYHNAIHDSDDATFAINDEASDDERRDAENQGAMHHNEYRHVNTHWDEHGCLVFRAMSTLGLHVEMKWITLWPCTALPAPIAFNMVVTPKIGFTSI